MEFEYTYILSSKKDRPILARFALLKQKQTVLDAFREKRKNGQVSGRVVEDLPDRIVKARTALYPFLEQCQHEGKAARYKQDKLMVCGELYEYDFISNKPILVAK